MHGGAAAMAAMDQSASLLNSLTTRTMRGQLPLPELCSMCESIYTSYNAAATTPDTHMEEFLAKHRIGFPGDRQFICQVFYGMTRYKKLLHALIQGFYFANRFAPPTAPPCQTPTPPGLPPPHARPVGVLALARGNDAGEGRRDGGSVGCGWCSHNNNLVAPAALVKHMHIFGQLARSVCLLRRC